MKDHLDELLEGVRERDDGFEHLVASVLDHPSLYMGGPSKGNIRKAQGIRKALELAGFAITPPKP